MRPDTPANGVNPSESTPDAIAGHSEGPSSLEEIFGLDQENVLVKMSRDLSALSVWCAELEARIEEIDKHLYRVDYRTQTVGILR